MIKYCKYTKNAQSRMIVPPFVWLHHPGAEYPVETRCTCLQNCTIKDDCATIYVAAPSWCRIYRRGLKPSVADSVIAQSRTIMPPK